MSQFFAYSQAAYVHQMRKFLGQRHPAQKLLVRHRPEGSQGRAPNYPPEVVAALEQAVNDKAATCEAADTAFCERLQWACDYAGVKDSVLARALGVSRQLVCGWKRGAYHPARLDALAEVLNVPRAWLQLGGEHSLLACSHIGARVGEEGLKYREELYGGKASPVGTLDRYVGLDDGERNCFTRLSKLQRLLSADCRLDGNSPDERFPDDGSCPVHCQPGKAIGRLGDRI